MRPLLQATELGAKGFGSGLRLQVGSLGVYRGYIGIMKKKMETTR